MELVELVECIRGAVIQVLEGLFSDTTCGVCNKGTRVMDEQDI
jgi:hypothetical protein